MGPTRHMQSLQKLIQDRIIGTLLESGTELQSPPLAVRLLDRFPLLRRIPARIVGLGFGREHIRSEEHTSELQSLMRISYAVFCLKKKNISSQIYKTTKTVNTQYIRQNVE